MPEITVTTSLETVREALAAARTALARIANNTTCLEDHIEAVERGLNFADIAADNVKQLQEKDRKGMEWEARLAGGMLAAKDTSHDLAAEIERLRTELWQMTSARDAIAALCKEANDRVAELETQRNHINDLPPSQRTLAALEVIRRPARREQRDGGGQS